MLWLAAIAIPRLGWAQVTPAAGAPGQDDTQVIRLGATIFYDYTYQPSPTQVDSAGNVYKPSAFNLARAYINVTGNISHIVSFRITPDIVRDTDTASNLNGSLVYRTKYGFAQFALDEWTGAWRQSWARIGIQQTPYIDAQEAVYRYRFQGTVFVERDFNVASSDAGATFHTSIPRNYGDMHVGVYNGEGYSKADTNNEKALQFRGTVRPLPTGNQWVKGLRVGIYAIDDHYVPNGPKDTLDGYAWYEHRRFNAGFEYVQAKNEQFPASSPVCLGTAPPATCGITTKSRGYSWFATPFFKEKGNGWEMLLRMDRYEPNEAAVIETIRKREIVGVAYWFPHPGGNAVAALMIDYQRVRQIGTPTQQQYFLHGLINF
jgi:hypothetical protein